MSPPQRRCANLSGVVALAIFVRGVDGDFAAHFLEVGVDSVRQALTVVVVGITNGDGSDAVFFRISATTTPWRASEGAVRKKRPLSSMVDSAGDVADGEIITTPLALATFFRTAVVTPEQSPPTIALTPSEVIKRSAVAVATAESMQVLSPRTASLSRRRAVCHCR